MMVEGLEGGELGEIEGKQPWRILEARLMRTTRPDEQSTRAHLGELAQGSKVGVESGELLHGGEVDLECGGRGERGGQGDGEDEEKEGEDEEKEVEDRR
ncbi:hypothetical protein ACLOJK_022680 [Asimina triloba]